MDYFLIFLTDGRGCLQCLQSRTQQKKNALRQGLLPPTDQAGGHPSEHYSHRLWSVSHTRLLQDFNNWRSIHAPEMPQSQDDLNTMLDRYFTHAESSHLSINSRANFSKYLQDFNTIANEVNALKAVAPIFAPGVVWKSQACLDLSTTV